MQESYEFLKNCLFGRLATIGDDGFPYITPIHHVLIDETLYFHGKYNSTKVSNFKKNNSVCYESDKIHDISSKSETNPCKTSTSYESVIAKGKAFEITDFEMKKSVLLEFVKKYTHQLKDLEIPIESIGKTFVFEMKIDNITYKKR